MTTDRELMQQALDALDLHAKQYPHMVKGYTADAAEAIRARLAQPEPPALTGIDCSCGRRWRVKNNTLTVSAQPEQEPIATLFGSLPVYDVPPAKPVAWVENLENARPHCVTDLKYCSVAQHERGEHLKYIPLYTATPQREWQGLTEYEVGFLTVFDGLHDVEVPLLANFIRHIEAKLKEKNA